MLEAVRGLGSGFGSVARKWVKAALPAHATGKPIEIWFQDEARVGQQGSLEYIWAEVGTRPRAVRDN